jgi:hypothetical protein
VWCVATHGGGQAGGPAGGEAVQADQGEAAPSPRTHSAARAPHGTLTAQRTPQGHTLTFNIHVFILINVKGTVCLSSFTLNRFSADGAAHCVYLQNS